MKTYIQFLECLKQNLWKKLEYVSEEGTSEDVTTFRILLKAYEQTEELIDSLEAVDYYD